MHRKFYIIIKGQSSKYRSDFVYEKVSFHKSIIFMRAKLIYVCIATEDSKSFQVYIYSLKLHVYSICTWLCITDDLL